MRTFSAVLLGKAVNHIIKFFRLGGGSAAPGLYALKIDANLITNLSKNIKSNIVITGTNGKTTTAKMLAHFAQANGLNVIRNHTGSNLERGIASTLIQNPGNFDLGVWELDEAAFNAVAPKLKPDAIVFLNVSRDQLDRYGEIDKVINNWCQTLKKIPTSTKLIINKDDKNLNILASNFRGKIQKFSLPKDIKLNGLDGTKFQISNFKFQIYLPVPGLYNVYNFLAAFSVGINLGLDPKKIVGSLKSFSPAFGRVEKLVLSDSEGSHPCYIFLIKNPAGATAVFQTLALSLKSNDRLLLALNDNIADGTDVSWIWDSDFEKLKIENFKLKILCSGTRAYDMALRLKYEDIDTEVEPDLEKALKQARTGLKGALFILPTYTAMLKLQSILAKQGLKKKYWETE